MELPIQQGFYDSHYWVPQNQSKIENVEVYRIEDGRVAFPDDVLVDVFNELKVPITLTHPKAGIFAIVFDHPIVVELLAQGMMFSLSSMEEHLPAVLEKYLPLVLEELKHTEDELIEVNLLALAEDQDIH